MGQAYAKQSDFNSYLLINVCISSSWEKLIFLSLGCPSAWLDSAAAASGFAPARAEAQCAAGLCVLGKVPSAAQPRWLCAGLLAEIMSFVSMIPLMCVQELRSAQRGAVTLLGAALLCWLGDHGAAPC